MESFQYIITLYTVYKSLYGYDIIDAILLDCVKKVSNFAARDFTQHYKHSDGYSGYQY